MHRQRRARLPRLLPAACAAIAVSCTLAGSLTACTPAAPRPSAASARSATEPASPTPTSAASLAADLPGPLPLSAVGPSADAEASIGPNGMIQGARNSESTAVDITTAAVAGGTVEQAQVSVPVDWNVLDDTRWAVGAQQGGTGSDFVVASMHHQDAQGLTPESWSTTLQTLAAGSSALGQQIVFGACKAVECQLSSVTLFGHVAVLAYRPGTDAASVTTTSDHLAAVDLDSGVVLWDHRGVDVDATTESAVVVEKSDPTYQGNTSVSAIDPTSGATAWTFHDANGRRATGFIGALGNRYALLTSPFTGSDGYAGVDTIDVVDLQNGALTATRYGHVKSMSWGYDPTTERIALAGVSADPKQYRDEQLGFEVITTGGEAVLTVDADQWAKLDRPSVMGALDGRIWIDGQSGVDLIVSDSGKQDPASPQLTGGSSTDSGSAQPLYPSRTVGHLTVVTGPQSYSNDAVVITVDGDPALEAVNGVSASS